MRLNDRFNKTIFRALQKEKKITQIKSGKYLYICYSKNRSNFRKLLVKIKNN